jgi:hypothetical protein
MKEVPRQVCVACSIFKREIEALQASGQFSLPVAYLNSMLHMVPVQLEQRLQEALASARAEVREPAVLIAYGDCCGHMERFAAVPGTARTAGINCCEIILGPEAYRRLRREGAFFLMPEWAVNWKKVFVSQLGLLGPCAREFMQEMHTRLIYLDTGILPVPERELAEASAFMGLPVEILPVSLEPLRIALQAAADAAARHD